MEDLNDDMSVKPVDQMKKRFAINKSMLPVKLTYFIWGCVNGTYGIYLNPFFISVGILETRTGILTGITFAVSSIAGPVWGMLSDYTGRQKLILTILCFVAAGSIASLPLVADTFVNPSNNVKVCNKSESVRSSVGSNGTTLGNISTDSKSSNISDNEMCVYKRENESNSLFYHLLVIVIFGAIFFNPMQGFAEAIALNFIKSSGEASYGAQRLFGSIGGCASLYLTGFIMDQYPLKGMSVFSMAFFMFAPFALLLVPLLSYLTIRKDRITKLTEEESDGILSTHDTALSEKPSDESSVMHQLRLMLQRLEVLVLLLTTLVAGLAFSLFIFFTTLLVEKQLKISKREASFIFVVLTIANTITFPLTSTVIKLLRGPIPIIIIGIFCHGIRNIVMSYTTSYWIMLTVQLLHSFDFALFWCAMMEYIHELSPPAIKVTMTLVLNSVKFQISPFILNVVGGMIYQKYGGQALFRWNGVLCCGWAAFLILFYSIRLLGRGRQKNKAKQELLNQEEHIQKATAM